MMEDPPTPMAIPKAAIKKDTGNTTLIAAMAVEPIQWPTNMVSTKIFNDMTRIPIDAGTACLIKIFPMGCDPKSCDDTFAITRLLFYLFMLKL
jgi:hypothetical protein